VFVFIGHDRLGVVTPDGEGRFVSTDMSAPGNLEPGLHSVTASCAPSATPTVATASIAITSAAMHRNAFVTSLHLPSQIPRGDRDLVISALGALVAVALVGFPAELFNSTLEENYDEVRGWLPLASRLGRPFQRIPPAAKITVMLVAITVLYGLLDPGLALNRASLTEILAMGISLVVLAAVSCAPTIIYTRLRHGLRGRLNILAGGMLIAAACVLVSRFVHFQPGYIYGIVIGVAIGAELPEHDNGRIAAMTITVILATGLLAWFAWAALGSEATGHAPSTAVVFTDTVLAAIAVAAIEGALFAMVPLRFLEGATIWRWNRPAWAALFALNTFLFVEILLRPGTGYVAHAPHSAAAVAILLLAGFALVSTGFWAYFRFRKQSLVTQP
jgi:hypothetical protein